VVVVEEVEVEVDIEHGILDMVPHKLTLVVEEEVEVVDKVLYKFLVVEEVQKLQIMGPMVQVEG